MDKKNIVKFEFEDKNLHTYGFNKLYQISEPKRNLSVREDILRKGILNNKVA